MTASPQRPRLPGSPVVDLILLLGPAGCGAAAHRAAGPPGGSGSLAAPPPTPAGGPPAPAPSSETDAEIDRVRAGVSALRGLPFRRAVLSSPQSRDQFRQVVRDDIARDLGPQKNLALSRALAHTGFLPRQIDYAATLEEAETTQVAAYYDPRTDRFHLVSLSGSADERDVVVAHELTHALQHQYFDLIAYDGGVDNAQQLSDDERTARRFVVEGEATFVMLAYQAGSGSGATRALGPLQVAGVRMSLTMLAAIDYVDLLAMIRTGEGASKLDSESRAALDALTKLPPLVAVPMIDPYIRGAFLISEAWARGGWARVAQLYRDPPQSTEQVLHPIEKLLDGRDPPIAIRLPPPARFLADVPSVATAPLLQQTAGELDWRCYFKTWNDPEPERAAAGWGGDLVSVWERDGKPLAGIATSWDTTADAEKFERAYLRTLDRRFGFSPGFATAAAKSTAARARRGRTGPPFEDPPTVIRRPDGMSVVIERRGPDVDIIDGARRNEIAPLLAMLRGASRTPVGPAPASRPAR